MKKALALLSILLGFFMALLDTTIVNITLPKMTDFFHTDVKTISWVLNGYNLAFAVLLITASRLADQFGRKKIYITGVITFTAASFLSGISSSISMLITFRVLQGLAAALVTPVTLPMSTQLVPPEKHGALMGFWGAFSGLAAASGPALGGILSQNFNWQAIFYINIPIGIVTVLLCIPLVKESKDPTASKRIDWLGIVTLSITMFCLTLALIQANDKGWTSSYILTLFAVSLVSFVLFFLIEFRSTEPMLPMWLFKNIPFTAASISLFMVGIALMCGVFLLAFYLTNVLGMSELKAGMLITALPLTSVVASAISGNLSHKWGNRWFTVLGMSLMGISIFLYGGLTPQTTLMNIIWRLMIGGVGLGFTMAPLMGAAISAVPEDKAGIASGIINMTRTIGTVLGVAILITVLNHSITNQMTKAKAEATSIVNNDASLNSQAKDKIVQNLASAKSSSSGTSSMPTEKDIIKQMEQARQKTIRDIPNSMKESVTDTFARQEKAITILYPKIQQIFQAGLSDGKDKAFSLISADKVLTLTAKNNMIENIKNGSETPKLSSILTQIESQKNSVLTQVGKSATNSVHAEFIKQENETVKVMGQTQSIFAEAMKQAKGSAVALVENDPVLNSQGKTDITANLDNASSAASLPSLSSILAGIENQKQDALENAPAQAQSSINQQFLLQENEVQKVYPLIEEIFGKQMTTAKSQAIANIEENKVLNAQGKASMKQGLLSNGPAPTVSEVIAQITKQDPVIASQAVLKAKQSVTSQFSQQETEVSRLYPVIQQTLTAAINHAKSQAIDLINGDTELTSTAKTKMIDSISATGTNGQQAMTLPSILDQLHSQEAKTLVEATQTAIKTANSEYAKQEKALSALYPKIQDIFKDKISAAFNVTFKAGSLILILGVLFGFFSDPGRRKEYQHDQRKEPSIQHTV